MSELASAPVTYRRGVIAPLDDLAEAWRRLRGQYWLFLAITAAGVLIGSVVPMGVLLGPMMCGIYGCYRHQRQGRPVRFERLFEGFDSHIFTQSLIATLIVMGVTMILLFAMIAVMVPVGIVVGLAVGDANAVAPVLFAAMFVAMMSVLLALTLVVGIVFAFAYPLIEDRRLTGVDAVKLSVRAARANIGGMLGLAAISSVLGFAGMCCCYVGVFLVLPVSFGAHMVAYEKVFGFAETAASE